MIDIRVLAVKTHPDQVSNNPGWWAVQFRVSHAGKSRSFWRWHRAEEKPSNDEALARFWSDVFGDLHGFDFKCEEAAS